jgi:hypothetical protein
MHEILELFNKMPSDSEMETRMLADRELPYCEQLLNESAMTMTSIRDLGIFWELNQSVWEQMVSGDSLPLGRPFVPMGLYLFTNIHLVQNHLWSSGIAHVHAFSQFLSCVLPTVEPIIRRIKWLDSPFMGQWSKEGLKAILPSHNNAVHFLQHDECRGELECAEQFRIVVSKDRMVVTCNDQTIVFRHK